MSSSFGERIKISLFGQSHSEGIGVVIDGLPAGMTIDWEQIRAFMGRRAPGTAAYTTSRKEEDLPKVLSGLVDDTTCGAPLCAVISNTDVRSKDYSLLKDVPRPGHADYAAQIKYGGFQDVRGGGHFSARLTAPLCFAGAICLQLLASHGITIGAHIASIAGIRDIPFDAAKTDASTLFQLKNKPMATLDDTAGEAMIAAILEAAGQKDSVGGMVECCAVGVPAGWGDPLFDGIENRLSGAIFAIPAVKGVEFGEGFAVANMRGSENNDAYHYDGNRIVTATNHHGGILGGITTGMPIVFRVAFKPTPSISQEQESISFSQKKDVPLVIQGRHDPCVVPRAVPCVEAAAAIVLADFLMKEGVDIHGNQ